MNPRKRALDGICLMVSWSDGIGAAKKVGEGGERVGGE